jgi:FkbM family methyltransferase
MKRIIKYFLGRINLLKEPRKSYSQCGEDLILDFLFKSKGIDFPTYIDIGAHHSTYLSNTYFFYNAGSTGICIEPDITLFEKIKNSRTRDICLNIGIGETDGAISSFYIMDIATLNTFSAEEAERMEREFGHSIKQIVEIPIRNINVIMEEYQMKPDFISIDVEGLDLLILKTIALDKVRPKAFVIETVQYSLNNTGTKISKIQEYMLAKGYLIYADTWVNTIFVDKDFLGTK